MLYVLITVNGGDSEDMPILIKSNLNYLLFAKDYPRLCEHEK